MATLIENECGRKIDFDAASDAMDQGIADSLDHGDGMTVRAFFSVYCAKHREKFGEEFEPNKPNPVW